VATSRQDLGAWGERLVTQVLPCPRCKTPSSLRRLPPNFKCADIICDFCGYLAQVKTASAADVDSPPKSLLGAAWEPQRRRMEAGIYFPLFLVLRAAQSSAIYYLPTEYQTKSLFRARNPLSPQARRRGWRGLTYDLREIPPGLLARIWRRPAEATVRVPISPRKGPSQRTTYGVEGPDK
jgi:type II restriction enzyme